VFFSGNFKYLVSVVAFDGIDPCNKSRDYEFCEQSKKFLNLVLVLSRADNTNKNTNYISYRLKENQTLHRITDEEMPWNLSSTGSAENGNFRLPQDYQFKGITFDETNNANVLYAIINSMLAGNAIAFKQINPNGSLASHWNLKNLKNNYIGLFDVNANVYALGKFNDVHQLYSNGKDYYKEVSLSIIL